MLIQKNDQRTVKFPRFRYFKGGKNVHLFIKSISYS